MKEPRVVALDYPGAELQLVATTKLERKRRGEALKEPFTAAWIESLPSSAVLYDVGANVGVFSLIAARRPQGRIPTVAFEPGFASFAALCQNLVLNRIGDEVIPLPIALGEATTLGAFAYADVASGAADHPGIASGTVAVYSQPSLVFALDDLLARFPLPRPTHVKLDVDGAEAAVLRGATKTLVGVEAVLVELGDRMEDIDAVLQERGFRSLERYKTAGGIPYGVYGSR
jgi:FkbM family methyltransferase